MNRDLTSCPGGINTLSLSGGRRSFIFVRKYGMLSAFERGKIVIVPIESKWCYRESNPSNKSILAKARRDIGY